MGGPTVDAEIESQFEPLVQKNTGIRINLMDRKSQRYPRSPSPPRLIPSQLIQRLAALIRHRRHGSRCRDHSPHEGILQAGHANPGAVFFLPLVHNENLISQLAAVAFYESLASRCPAGQQEAGFTELGIQAAESHRDIIARFGRFPRRNQALGRENTPEEAEFLKEHPSGY